MTRSRSQATKALDIEVVERLDEAEALAVEWDALAVRAEAGPFSAPAFALAWWRHLGNGRLQIVVVRNRAGDLVGVAPLHERRYGPLRVVRWLGHGLGTVGELLTSDSRADVGSAIWEAMAGSDRFLDLSEYRHNGTGLTALRHATQWKVHAELRDQCMTIELDRIESVAEFLASPQRRGIRKKLAKVDRTMAASGLDLTIDVVTGDDELSKAVDAITPIFDAAEEAHPRLHMLAPPYRDFLIDALDGTARSGRLALFVARIAGRPVAFDVYTRSGSVAFAWLGRFDPVAAASSPGHLLLRAGVEWAIQEGIETIDLQLGADQYKQRWSTGSYDTLRVVAAPDALRLRVGRASLGALSAAHDARSRVGSVLA